MHVAKLELSGFTVHDNTVVELPASGVVLVTGANGSGKSSLMEAVSWALWGKTLRGAIPYRAGQECRVQVALGKVPPDWLVERRRVGDRAFLRRMPAVGGEWTAHANATKAQEDLDSLVGSWDVWRRSSVFSSADAAHFSMATDGERKRLLEALLGLDRFDVALEACRKDLRSSSSTALLLAGDVQVFKAKLEGAATRLTDAMAAMGRLPVEVDVVEAERKLASIQAMAVEGRKDIALLRHELQELSARGGGLAADERQMAQRLQALRVEVCPTCGQQIPGEKLAVAERDYAVAVGNLAAARKLYADTSARVNLDLSELEAEDAVLRHQAAELQASVHRAVQDQAQRASAEKVLGAARRDVSTFTSALADRERRLQESQVHTATLEACEVVLGLKGVRAQVLGKALSGLEQAANAWLSRIAAPGVSVRLRPYTEKKTGGVSDSLGLEIEGVGGGLGYRAASGGERRRLDIALMLALADVAVAAHGGGGGTLWLDEVMDALDVEGMEAVSEVLSDLARDRAVVVVSHSDALATRLRPVVRLHVADGRI